MASSGTFYRTTTGLKMTVEWSTVSVDKVNNKTKIKIRSYLTPTKGGFWTSATPRNCPIVVDSSSMNFTKVFDTVANNQKVLLGERIETVTHGTNGKRDVYIRADCGIRLVSYNGNRIENVWTASTVTLDDINRLSPTINNFSITAVTKNSVIYRAEASHAYGIDLIQYRLNGGTWINQPSNTTITGLTQNTAYTLQVRFRAGNGLWVESSILNFTTEAENQDPPVYVDLNVTALSENSISVVSQFTQSANLPITKVVSLDNGISYPYSEGNILTLNPNTTYQVIVKATASNGKVTLSPMKTIKTFEVMPNKRQFYGKYGEGIIWSKIDDELEINPNYVN